MAEGTDFYLGKMVEVHCDSGEIFHGTLLNIDKYGNLDIVSKESPESDRKKFTIMRQKVVAVGTILEKII